MNHLNNNTNVDNNNNTNVDNDNDDTNDDTYDSKIRDKISDIRMILSRLGNIVKRVKRKLKKSFMK